MLKSYSLRFKLLVAEMDVSRTKIHLDTFILVTSNSERREYQGRVSIWRVRAVFILFIFATSEIG